MCDKCFYFGNLYFEEYNNRSHKLKAATKNKYREKWGNGAHLSEKRWGGQLLNTKKIIKTSSEEIIILLSVRITIFDEILNIIAYN